MIAGLLARASDPEKRRRLEDELACPPLPHAARYVWSIFIRLSRRRSSSGFGPSPVTWLEIDAFQRVAGVRLTRWEIEIVEMLDDLWLSATAPSKD